MRGSSRGIIYDFDAWGPAFWTTLHAITFAYPDEPTAADKDRAIQLFALVPFLLPCGVCGLHFAQTMAQRPLTDEVLASRATFSRWLNEVHNLVNERLNKRQVSYAEAEDMFLRRGCASAAASQTRAFKIVVIVMGVCLALAVALLVFLLVTQR